MTSSTPQEVLRAAAHERWALTALFVGALAVAASTVFVRLTDLAALPSAFYRPFLAIPALWLWMRWQDAGSVAASRPSGARDFALLFGAGAFFAGDLAFWHLSIHHTTIANATLFANTAPIHVALVGWLFLGWRPTKRFLAGMLLAILGSACLVADSLTLRPENLTGDVFGLVTAMFLAGYILMVERLRHRFSTATIMTWTSIGTAAVLLPVALASGETMVSQTAYGWAMLLCLALISHAAGQGMIAYALAYLPAAFTAVGLLLESVAAALLGVLVLGELLSWWQFAGGLIVLAGIALARRGVRK